METLLDQYALDLKVLKQEGYITNDMSDEQKYKMIRLNQQWLLCDQSDDGIMGITKKKQWMLQNPDNFEYGLLGKNVYFIHCGKIGEGYIYGVARWYNRMYFIKSNYIQSGARISEDNLYLTLEELFKALNSKYKIEEIEDI